jgi:hypothetical protein
VRFAERLAVDPETASETYYACLLSYAGCTADAEIAAELFGGAMTTHFVPAMFGSPRELMAGIVRSLPDPERPRRRRPYTLVRGPGHRSPARSVASWELRRRSGGPDYMPIA